MQILNLTEKINFSKTTTKVSMLKKREELVPANVLFSQRKSCSNTQLIPLMLHLMIETFIFFKNLFGELHMSCCTVVQLVGHKLKPSSTTVAVLSPIKYSTEEANGYVTRADQ